VEGNSLERIPAYLNIEHEEEPKSSGEPPAYWPSSGDLHVENLCARYSVDGSNVLTNISFHVKGGEHIGVVGRSGCGKSSLAISLLRCIPTEGTVYYDGVLTFSLNLDALRSRFTIIPQAVSSSELTDISPDCVPARTSWRQTTSKP
jgi:ABC-type multidrug transport system fused ATPase/permease subunit